jgi:hypothetical protein
MVAGLQHLHTITCGRAVSWVSLVCVGVQQQQQHSLSTLKFLLRHLCAAAVCLLGSTN